MSSARVVYLTERLRLEPVRADSAEQLVTLHADPGIARWYAGAWSLEHATVWAAGMAGQWSRDGVGKWLAYRRADGELIGRGGLSHVRVLGERRLEVGWAVRQSVWGMGFATEIGAAALRLAFDERGASEVVAFTEVHNHNSRRVMERLGMHDVREFRHPGLIAGRTGVHDDARFELYRLTRSDWRGGDRRDEQLS